MPHCKKATEESPEKAARLLESIRAENPDLWPYGLEASMFEPGDLFLVYKQAGEGPVGFVGWQERQVGPEKVGFYAIGMLPQYRRQGLAKEAVSKLLVDRAGRVDRLAALIAPGNTPSEALAKSLGIPKVSPVRKSASAGLKALWHAAKGPLAGGIGSTIFFDQVADPHGRSLSSTLQPWTWDKERALMGGLNAAGGALFGRYMQTGQLDKALPTFLAIPGKDLIMKGIGTLQRLDPALVSAEKLTSNLPKEPSSLPLLAGAGLLAATGGLGALVLSRALRNQGSRGKLKVTLPTRHPGDAETVVEIPYDQQQAMTEALRKRLEIDTKRRLYAETKERIRRRNPDLLSGRGRLNPTNLEEP